MSNTYANFVQATLGASLSASATSIALAPVVAPYNLPPATGGILILADSIVKPSRYEIISYTSISGTTISGLVRGLEGSTAQVWPLGTYCYQSLTAADFTKTAKTAHKAYLNQLLDLGI